MTLDNPFGIVSGKVSGLDLFLIRHLFQMNPAIGLMVIDTQSLLATGKPTSPAFGRGF
jgi:hypothetical protein